MTKSINEWSREIGAWGERKGWHKPPLCEMKSAAITPEQRETVRTHFGQPAVDILPSRTQPQGVDTNAVLVHTELSEAVEHARDGQYIAFDNDGKPDGFVIELADAMIRIMHLADLLGLDLEDAVERKMAYNEKRPYRHGDRKA